MRKRYLMNKELISNHLIKIFGDSIGNNTQVDWNDKGDQLRDVIVRSNSRLTTIELKERRFESAYKRFYDEGDILIELIQNTTNQSKLASVNPHYLNSSLGWFYKCSSDYVCYYKYLDSKEVTIYTLNWKEFFPWLIDRMEFNKYSQADYIVSNKTTGAINLSVDVKTIPKRMILIEKIVLENKSLDIIPSRIPRNKEEK